MFQSAAVLNHSYGPAGEQHEHLNTVPYLAPTLFIFNSSSVSGRAPCVPLPSTAGYWIGSTCVGPVPVDITPIISSRSP